jgi:hypothetical protein
MSRSRSLYCHSDTGPTGPTALILREQIRSSLSRTGESAERASERERERESCIRNYP